MFRWVEEEFVLNRNLRVSDEYSHHTGEQMVLEGLAAWSRFHGGIVPADLGSAQPGPFRFHNHAPVTRSQLEVFRFIRQLETGAVNVAV